MPLGSGEESRLGEGAGLSVEECLERGLWECDPIYYAVSDSSLRPPSLGKRQKRGKAFRQRSSAAYVAFESYDGHVYRIGDTVFLESQQPELPYFICGIQGFKMTKKEQLNVYVRWFYRTSEVPESVLISLTQDRRTEEHSLSLTSEASALLRSRELFISDAHDTYSVSNLRGGCVVRQLRDIGEAERGCSEGGFFYVLGYNPESCRLASIQGEIRVGPSHQARLPPCQRPNAAAAAATAASAAASSLPSPDYLNAPAPETLLWMPGQISDTSLHTYISASRSLFSLANLKPASGGDDPAPPASRDATHSHALHTLHSVNYETGPALKRLVCEGVAASPETLWAEEDVAKFKKGLRSWGKNFFRIRKELLSHKTTGDLIEFYYLWKRSPAAKNQTVRKGQRKPGNVILRRIKAPSSSNSAKPQRPSSSELLDLSSASEGEESEEGAAELKEGYACHHCYTTASKDWHHCGKDRLIFCTECRLYFKRYGELRPVDRARTPPPYLFKAPSDDASGEAWDDGVKTRGRLSASKDIERLRRRTYTPTPDMESGRKSKSPSEISTTSSSSMLDTDPLGKEEIKGTSANLAKRNGKKGKGKRKRRPEDKPNRKNSQKRKRILEEANRKVTEEGGEESETSSPPPSGENSSPTSPAPPASAQSSSAADVTLSNPPTTIKSELPDEEKEANGDVYDFQEESAPADSAATAPRLLPKAETSVIRVNMEKGPGDEVITIGCTRFHRLGEGEEMECARTYLAYHPKPDADWLQKKERRRQAKKEPREPVSEGSAASAGTATSARTSQVQPASSAQPSATPAPLPPIPSVPQMGGPNPAFPGLPPGHPFLAAAAAGANPAHVEQLMMAAMMGMTPPGFPQGFPPFAGPHHGQHPNPFLSPHPQHAAPESAMAHLHRMAAQQGHQAHFFAMVAKDPMLLSRVCNGEFGVETLFAYVDFAKRSGIAIPPALETKASMMVQQQHDALNAQALAQAQRQAMAQAEAQRQKELERKREEERRAKIEKERKEREERERKAREERARQEKLRQEEEAARKAQAEAARLAAAAAAAALTPAPSVPPTPHPGPPAFLNGLDPRLFAFPADPGAQAALLQAHSDAAMQHQLQLQYQQCTALAASGNLEAQRSAQHLQSILQHHFHAHTHTHLHLPPGLTDPKAGGPRLPGPPPGDFLPLPMPPQPHPSQQHPFEMELLRNRIALEQQQNAALRNAASAASSDMMRRLQNEGNPAPPPPTSHP